MKKYSSFEELVKENGLNLVVAENKLNDFISNEGSEYGTEEPKTAFELEDKLIGVTYTMEDDEVKYYYWC